MTDKERLDDIKNEFNNDLKLGYAPAEEDEIPMKWLIERAERANELEAKYSRLEESLKKQTTNAFDGWEKVGKLEKENQDHLFTISDLEFQISRLRLQIGRGIT